MIVRKIKKFADEGEALEATAATCEAGEAR
jgi:hypothetical protein